MIPSYAYTYIKIGFLKKLIMDQDSLNRLEELDEIEKFVEFVTPFYPDFSIDEYTIEQIEGELYNSYINVVGQIIVYSPDTMRSLLKRYLLKFEIRNIKQAVIDTILGTPLKQKRKNININVEELLDKEEFMNELVEIHSLDEIQLFMRDTQYEKAIREGILYFRKNNEIFVLEAFLDKIYYDRMANLNVDLNRKEKKLIKPYLSLVVEIYNLNTIYRGIINEIEKELLKQFIVDHHLFLENDMIQTLLYKNSQSAFFAELKNFFNTEAEELKGLFDERKLEEKNFEDYVKRLYYSYYFNKFKQVQIDDIDLLTILRIIEVILKKKREIESYILPKVVKILHHKYYSLKDQISNEDFE
ncbi:MAG: V-type ATPase subunit [Promethearchaeia archaeon]